MRDKHIIIYTYVYARAQQRKARESKIKKKVVFFARATNGRVIFIQNLGYK